MMMSNKFFWTLSALALTSAPVIAVSAQQPAASATVRQSGTVTSVSGTTVVFNTAAGVTYTVQALPTARVVQLAPGSTDLKSAQPTTLENISVGDRILVAGKAGDGANTLNATQLVVMKSTDIAQRNQQLTEDWQKRGTGGIVSAMDTATGTITLKSGAHSISVSTSASTIYRRYAPGSVKYEDAKPSTLQQIAVGDQMQVRGDKSADGTTDQAEEIVYGSFQNISGLVASVDAAARTLTLKDLASKKTVTVRMTDGTDLRTLPPEAGARLAMRLKAASPAGAGAAATHRPSSGGEAAGAASAETGQGPRGTGAHSGGGDLSQMIPHLPATTAAELKAGEALMIVASKGAPSEPLIAITVLSGVEPILSAAPSGSQGMTLSPWSLGGGASGDAGGIQ